MHIFEIAWYLTIFKGVQFFVFQENIYVHGLAQKHECLMSSLVVTFIQKQKVRNAGKDV